MPHIPKAVCVPCGVQFKILKNGFEILMKAQGAPYYQISADLYYCPNCGTQIATGFAQKPYWQNYYPEPCKVIPDAEVNL